jgi:hypothetical protein
MSKLCFCEKPAIDAIPGECGKHWFHAKCYSNLTVGAVYCAACDHDEWLGKHIPALELTAEERDFPNAVLSTHILPLKLTPTFKLSEISSMLRTGVNHQSLEANNVNAHRLTNVNMGAAEWYAMGYTNIQDLIEKEFGRNHLLRRLLYPPAIMAYWFDVQPRHIIDMGITMDDLAILNFTARDLRSYGLSAPKLAVIGLKKQHNLLYSKTDWELLGVNQGLLSILE